MMKSCRRLGHYKASSEHPESSVFELAIFFKEDQKITEILCLAKNFSYYQVFFRFKITYENLEPGQVFQIKGFKFSEFKRSDYYTEWKYLTNYCFICIEQSKDYAVTTDVITLYRLMKDSMKLNKIKVITGNFISKPLLVKENVARIYYQEVNFKINCKTVCHLDVKLFNLPNEAEDVKTVVTKDATKILETGQKKIESEIKKAGVGVQKSSVKTSVNGNTKVPVKKSVASGVGVEKKDVKKEVKKFIKL